MNELSRRHFLSSYGAALAAPVAVQFAPIPAFGQDQGPMPGSSSSTIPFSVDLLDYVVGHAVKRAVNSRSGIQDPIQQKSLHQSLALLANHLDDSGFTAGLSSRVNDPAFVASLPSTPVPALPDGVFQIIQKHDPTGTTYDYTGTHTLVTPDETKAALAALSSTPISNTLRDAADRIRQESDTTPSGALAVAYGPANAHLKYPLYERGAPARYMVAGVGCSNILASLSSATCTAIRHTIAVLGVTIALCALWSFLGTNPFADACVVVLGLIAALYALIAEFACP